MLFFPHHATNTCVKEPTTLYVSLDSFTIYTRIDSYKVGVESDNSNVQVLKSFGSKTRVYTVLKTKQNSQSSIRKEN